METVKQLAAEAWKQITDYADNCEDAIGDLAGDTNCIRFIQAAIEKATEPLLTAIKSAINDNEMMHLFNVLDGIPIEALREQCNSAQQRLQQAEKENSDKIRRLENLTNQAIELKREKKQAEKDNERLIRLLEIAAVNARKGETIGNASLLLIEKEIETARHGERDGKT